MEVKGVERGSAQLDAPIFTWDFRDFGPVAAGLGLRLLVEPRDLEGFDD